MINKIEDNYITDAVRYIPILFMALSFSVMGVGAYLTKEKKRRPKKQFF